MFSVSIVLIFMVSPFQNVWLTAAAVLDIFFSDIFLWICEFNCETKYLNNINTLRLHCIANYRKIILFGSEQFQDCDMVNVQCTMYI